MASVFQVKNERKSPRKGEGKGIDLEERDEKVWNTTVGNVIE